MATLSGSFQSVKKTLYFALYYAFLRRKKDKDWSEEDPANDSHYPLLHSSKDVKDYSSNNPFRLALSHHQDSVANKKSNYQSHSSSYRPLALDSWSHGATDHMEGGYDTTHKTYLPNSCACANEQPQDTSPSLEPLLARTERFGKNHSAKSFRSLADRVTCLIDCEECGSHEIRNTNPHKESYNEQDTSFSYEQDQLLPPFEKYVSYNGID